MKDFIYLLKVFNKYIGPRKIYLLIFLTILVALADGFGIAMVIPLLEAFDINKKGDATHSFLHNITEFFGIDQSLTGVLIFIVIIFLFKATLSFGQGVFKGILYKNLLRHLKINMYDLLMNVDYNYFTQKNAGYFITLISVNINSMLIAFNYFIGVITAMVMALTYVAFAALVSWQTALFAMGIGIIIMLAFTILNRYIKKLSTEDAKEQAILGQTSIQALHSFKYMVSTGKIYTLRNIFNRSVKKTTAIAYKNGIANAFTLSLRELVAILLVVSLIIIEVRYIGNPIASVFVVLLLFYRGVNQFVGVQTGWQTVLNNIGFIIDLDKEMITLKKHQIIGGKKQFSENENDPLIKFEQLDYKYPNASNKSLNQINLSVYKNQTIAFVGASGAGKTTIVDVMTGLLISDQGKLLLGGHHIKNLNLQSWRNKIGYVSQDLTIYDDSILNNICLWEIDPDLEKVKSAAQKANANQFIESLPNGYHTEIGDKGVRLSGGQRQRLFIARELYKNPEVLILDEATSALDSQSEKSIQDSIDALKHQITVIIIAHRLATIKNVDYIYVMQDGQIIESGTYQELINSDIKQHFSEMVKMQSL